ncbi:aldehyde dehydrogenase family protein [Acidovorax sp. JHL-9]|uniref:L-piperidine-6-carboxylate dehydrogenase n=1 Tax=Acidovorax sp. JHL-9 TaxID=1276756 RepID=UPI0003FF33E8|nr:aldehyde dehydrogenase family protein [Acidovorax sp. JHL-9]
MPATLAAASLVPEVDPLLQRLGVPRAACTGGTLAARSPITGEVLAQVPQHSAADAIAAIGRAHAAFQAWRNVPAPRRGELVRLLGEELRAAKADLGLLVTIEAGKIPSEGLGEVQEMIDICDFAVGLSRQLYGLTIATERPGHRMMETWHPLGVCGVISAFNFPVAVWSWNAALALVCGDSVVWKPSEKTPLTALATHAIAQRAIARFKRETGSDVPEGLLELIVGRRDMGEVLVDDARVPVLSATGSTAMGRAVGPRLAARFARGILELGGNNAAIVAPTADLDLALRGIAFAAMGTAGQRCTTLRRLFVHESIYDQLVPQLVKVYANVQVGDPRTPGTLVGPLIDRMAFDGMQKALAQSRTLGATVHGGGRVEGLGGADAYYVRPALVELPRHEGPALQETFAPILYVTRYSTLDEAIAMNNAAGAGLSSSIFTLNLREAEQFMSASGSDCGIANVNIGPSGAEIGGAFGGEKETGGGREAGSDSWKAYMRRATNTINYSTALPLAQGVKFDV